MASHLTINLARASKKAPNPFFYTIDFKHGFPGHEQRTKRCMATVPSACSQLEINFSVGLKRSHPTLTVPFTLLISTDVSNNGGYLSNSKDVQSTKHLVLAGLHPWSCPSLRLLYNVLQPFQSALLSPAEMATINVFSLQKFQFKYLY